MIRVIVNPAGAGGAASKAWEKARTYLENNNVRHEVFFSSEDRGIDRIIKDICDNASPSSDDPSVSQPLTLIIIGGDGSLNIAVNSIPDPDKVRIGFIPCGSANDLALSAGISKDPEEELEKILSGSHSRDLDIGEMTCKGIYDAECRIISESTIKRRFNISCGIGFDAAICHEAETTGIKSLLNKVRLGKLSYLAAALKTIFNSERTEAYITTDGKTVRYRSLLLAIAMNQPYEGGGFKFCPDASADDGIMDFCAADGLGTADFFRIFPYAYSGKHVKFNGVIVGKATEIVIKTTRPMWLHTDGEVSFRADDVSIRFCKEKLHLLN